MVEIVRRISTPWHVWLVGVLSFLWNALFVWQWMLQVTGDPAYWAGMSPAEAAYLRNVPLWTDIAVGVAFWGGLLGAALLLLRRRQATMVFAVALIAMLADTAYVHFMSQGREIMGPVGVALGLILIGVLIAQTVYCAWMSRRGVIV